MKRPAPPPRALASARDWLRALSAARQVYTLYHEGHPNRRETLRVLLDRTRELRLSAGTDPVLFVTRHSFYLGPTLLARESLSLFRLVEAFEEVGIEAVEPWTDVAIGDLDGLVKMLRGEEPLSTELQGLAVNRVRPEVDEEAASEEASELRRSYAIGLDFLRDAAMRAAAGRSVDLTTTQSVVDRLVNHIERDPTQALLLTTVKSYDEYTYYHMMNVCLLTVALGHGLGLHRDQIVVLGMGAILHDIGKLNVPREVLNHVGPLSEEQWRIVQRHPVEGAGLIFSTRGGLFHPAAPVVLEHHAAFDLSGYPALSGRSNPSLPARLVSVADCFDAVTSKRSYRRAEERRQALNILIAGAGRGFDPAVVRSFVRLLGVFPVGSMVRLTTGEVGIVVQVDHRLAARPVVRIVLDGGGDPVEPREIDLAAAGEEVAVARSVDPSELGIDVSQLIATGSVDQAVLEPTGPVGLVHEPSPGETPPPGYVDTHNPGGAPHARDLDGDIDPDVAPPFEG
ncbi:MAG: HD-GYP domain-containing protein [Actinobacteria bacterium]|nr:HD-GYP domain-containing protein [Actinomycetota bacterium]